MSDSRSRGVRQRLRSLVGVAELRAEVRSFPQRFRLACPVAMVLARFKVLAACLGFCACGDDSAGRALVDGMVDAMVDSQGTGPDVTATFADGILVIHGNADANTIAVT